MRTQKVVWLGLPLTECCDFCGVGWTSVRHPEMVQVFEFSCVKCGPFCTIPIDDVRLHRKGANSRPRRCSQCGGPISIDVVYDYDPKSAALLSAASRSVALPGVARLEHRIGAPGRS